MRVMSITAAFYRQYKQRLNISFEITCILDKVICNI
jgi:hypothetical protein